MNTHAIRPTLVRAFGVALALASGSASAITYRLTDLGTLGGTFSFGADLNDSGQVTGSSTTADGLGRAFLWDGTTMHDLGTVGPTSSLSGGIAINASGQVTGIFSKLDTSQAFFWDGMMMRDLGTRGAREFS